MKAKDEKLYKDLKHTLLNAGTNIPTLLGRQIGLTAYHVAQKIFKFN